MDRCSTVKGEKNMEDIELYPGIWFKTQKGKYCQLITIALNEETGEKVAVYQRLYGDFKTCVMKRDIFLQQMKPVLQSKVTKPRADRNMARQGTGDREQIKIEETRLEEIKKAVARVEAEKENKEKAGREDFSGSQLESDEDEATRVLMAFLEADTYREKRNIFGNMRNKDNIRILRNIAASLDLSLDYDKAEDYYDAIMSCLSARVRFEVTR